MSKTGIYYYQISIGKRNGCKIIVFVILGNIVSLELGGELHI